VCSALLGWDGLPPAWHVLETLIVASNTLLSSHTGGGSFGDIYLGEGHSGGVQESVQTAQQETVLCKASLDTSPRTPPLPPLQQVPTYRLEKKSQSSWCVIEVKPAQQQTQSLLSAFSQPHCCAYTMLVCPLFDHRRASKPSTLSCCTSQSCTRSCRAAVSTVSAHAHEPTAAHTHTHTQRAVDALDVVAD